MASAVLGKPQTRLTKLMITIELQEYIESIALRDRNGFGLPSGKQ